jgi:hypothetical protein
MFVELTTGRKERGLFVFPILSHLAKPLEKRETIISGPNLEYIGGEEVIRVTLDFLLIQLGTQLFEHCDTYPHPDLSQLLLH